jgi:hypothetical protein
MPSKLPRKITQQVADLSKAITASIAGAITSLRGGLDSAAIKAQIAVGRGDKVVEGLVWSAFIQKLGAFVDGVTTLAATTASEGVGAPASLNLRLAFDKVDPRAVAFAQNRVGSLVQGITAQQRSLIQTVITTSVRDGLTATDASELVGRVIGLTDRGAVALEGRFQSVLADGLKSGMSYGQAKNAASASADAYRQTLIMQRSSTIARTEIMTAQNAGRSLGWQEAQDQGLVSQDALKQVVCVDPCPICLAMEGEEVGINDSFSNGEDMPPFHPNCECTAILKDNGSSSDGETLS